MNKSMQYAFDATKMLEFSVQSEKEIWWLVTWDTTPFHRCHYTTTKWSVCSSWNVGEFHVEWHLGGDLKTIKCILGCKLWVCSINPCPMCMKKVVASTQGKENGTRLNGVLSCDKNRTPSRDREDKAWKPIIPLPLSREHFYTHHYQMHIDKLIDLHIQYAYNMHPKTRS